MLIQGSFNNKIEYDIFPVVDADDFTGVSDKSEKWTNSWNDIVVVRDVVHNNRKYYEIISSRWIRLSVERINNDEIMIGAKVMEKYTLAPKNHRGQDVYYNDPIERVIDNDVTYLHGLFPKKPLPWITSIFISAYSLACSHASSSASEIMWKRFSMLVLLEAFSNLVKRNFSKTLPAIAADVASDALCIGGDIASSMRLLKSYNVKLKSSEVVYAIQRFISFQSFSHARFAIRNIDENDVADVLKSSLKYMDRHISIAGFKWFLRHGVVIDHDILSYIVRTDWPRDVVEMAIGIYAEKNEINEDLLIEMLNGYNRWVWLSLIKRADSLSYKVANELKKKVDKKDNMCDDCRREICDIIAPYFVEQELIKS